MERRNYCPGSYANISRLINDSSYAKRLDLYVKKMGELFIIKYDLIKKFSLDSNLSLDNIIHLSLILKTSI